VSRLQDTVARLRQEIPEVTPAEVAADEGSLILDVREGDEWNDGHLPDALHLSRGFLEFKIEATCPDRGQPIVLYCGSGQRSLFAADALRQLGYSNVSSMAGGFQGWKEAGLAFEIPDVMAESARARYSRHVLIPEVGETGQRKLLDAKVLVVGVGGLGSPAALYLAAAGVGHLGIIDDDVVDRSNLQRQVIHTDDRIGTSKVESARRTINALNPEIHVEAIDARLTAENAVELIERYDIIVDGCDNFTTRYLVNDVCVELGKPNVHGSIHRFDGQVSVFWPGRGPCYRCLHPEPPPPELSPNCAELGVLGVLPGVIGLLEATETIKLILGIGEPLVGRLLTYDALQATFSEFRLRRRDDCAACGSNG